MTGAPAFEYIIKDTDNMWEIIKKADKDNFIMCAGISGENGEEKDKELGLVAGHAYGLL